MQVPLNLGLYYQFNESLLVIEIVHLDINEQDFKLFAKINSVADVNSLSPEMSAFY